LIAVQLRWSLRLVLNDIKLKLLTTSAVSDTSGRIAMVRLTKVYRSTIPVRDRALALIAGVDHKDYMGQYAAIYAWVRDAVQYVRDVVDVETLQTPIETLRSMAGDCDDKSLLLAALLQSVGFAVRFVAVGFDGPDSFDHVYIEARVGQHWIAADATEREYLGWYPPHPTAKLVYHV